MTIEMNPIASNGNWAKKSPRYDFSKIRTAVRIPNLIEVQRESYDRFLQMDLLPPERDLVGLQAVFRSTFPISDFRETSSLEFVEFRLGNWQCKCGQMQGLHHLRSNCRQCGSVIKINPLSSDDIICGQCGTYNKNIVNTCDNCGEPVGLKHKYDVQECQERGMTYSVPLHVKIRLTVWDKDEETAQKSIRDIKEEEVYFGDLPLMTENGTFVINGTERVIVSQLHRSPGVFFEKSENNTSFLAKLIPYRGSWVEFEYDSKNLLYVRIDRKRKFLATIFLRALGLKGDEDILRYYYTVDKIRVAESGLFWHVSPSIIGSRSSSDIVAKNGDVLVKNGKKIGPEAYKSIVAAGVMEIPVKIEDLTGAYTLGDLVNTSDGEVIAESNTELTAETIAKVVEAGITLMEIFFPDKDDVGTAMSATVRKDTIKTSQEALIEIYRKMRPGDPPTLDTSQSLFHGMFFDARKFDFSRVGRLKFNIKMGRPERERLDDSLLSPQDFFDVIDYVLKLKRVSGEQKTRDGRTIFYGDDDIDHLGNRRVRAVGELLENQFRLGLVRMERAIKEKMSIHTEMQTAMPRDLINAKPVTAAVREFFGSSQLSQFMDQTNPLSEITHKRRLSALGPGGLSRERAGFEVRDVHPTHYGRICPIETPEGPNIGLISSLSCFARINEFGFIESPYRKVVDGHVVDYLKVINPGDSQLKPHDHIPEEEAEKINKQIGDGKKKATFEPYPFYLSAWEEDKYIIGQANIELDKNGRIVGERVNARQAGEFILATRDKVQFMDVSPKQLVSVAASLIPFLENDDANRALMGSNMQRQAVPLLRAQAPLIGTGMEKVTAQDSGAVVIARRDGVIDTVDSERIIIRVDHNVDGTLSREVTADIYPLIKFKRSNQNTCINQKPIVRKGERVAKGQVVADGPCTEGGELALGRNVLVAFMPWRGYNFEDAILISEKMVKNDYYTSIHIEELEIESRDTKLGPE
ncbi:MAG: DNA-directed RNA polymerase subunit beta, partial [Acidobacteriota bacterium]|nr:DNA-directed RNA polymerase subunit beta [Acidobacteriota bacterium]